VEMGGSRSGGCDCRRAWFSSSHPNFLRRLTAGNKLQAVAGAPHQ